MQDAPLRRTTIPLSIGSSDRSSFALRQKHEILFVRSNKPGQEESRSLTGKQFEKALLREEALHELWFLGQHDNFCSFIFPIYLQKREIANWAQLKEYTKREDRKSALKTVKIRRCAAMLRKLEFIESTAENRRIGVAEQDSAIKRYEAALDQDLITATTPEEFYDVDEWQSLLSERKQYIFQLSPDEEKHCREAFPQDEEIQTALLQLLDYMESQPQNSVEHQQQTGAGGGATTQNSVEPQQQIGGVLQPQTPHSVGSTLSTPQKDSGVQPQQHQTVVKAATQMPIPDEPNTVDSQWASKFLNNIEKAGREGQVIPSVLVSPKLRVAIQVLLTSHKVIGKGVAWEDALTFKDMLRAVKNLGGGEFVRTPQTTVQKIMNHDLKLSRKSIQNDGGPLSLHMLVYEDLEKGTPLSVTEEELILEHFKDKLENEVDQPTFYSVVKEDVFHTNPPTTVVGFIEKLNEVVAEIARCHAKVDKCTEKRKSDNRTTPTGSTEKKLGGGGGKGITATKDTKPCSVCNRNLLTCTDHTKGQPCPYSDHPNANKSSKPWKNSAFASTMSGLGWNKLPAARKLVGTELVRMEDDELKRIYSKSPDILDKILNKSGGGKPAKKKVSDIFTRNSISYLEGTSSFNPHVIGRLVDKEIGQGILDSGSFGYIANYISLEAYENLAKLSLVSKHKCSATRVCSIKHCFLNDTCTTFELELTSSNLSRKIKIPFTARIVKGLPYDFIIGLPSVRKHKLARFFDDIFEDNEIEADKGKNKRQCDNSDPRADATLHHRQWKRHKVNTQSSSIHSEFVHTSVAHDVQGDEHHCDSCGDQSRLYCIQCSSQRKSSLAFTGQATSCPYEMVTTAVTVPLHSVPLSNNIRERYDLLMEKLRSDARNVLMPIVHSSALLDTEDDTDYLDDYLEESPHDMLMNNDTIVEPGLDQMIIQGTDKFKTDYLALRTKFLSRFKANLGPEAAYVEPFHLELKEDSTWFSSAKHQLAPRQMTRAKESAIDKFVEKALATDLIEESQASSWSQPHLTPKTNGDWRFCVDYRYLNENSKSLGWPLPNIRQMLERIGTSKPKVFAVLDLTQGYYQTSISVESRPYTTFRTSKGLYQWKRLPMGLKGAPSYFQHAMQSTVLGGLLQSTCEVYLDDIIVYAQTEQELLHNLGQVFARLEQYNITLNPAKVRVGLDSVEYVGHKIDREGLSFSDEKREDVWKTPLPITKKQLKSFLGLCVQFKDHVRNYSTLVAPLHALLPAYTKKEANQPIIWTDATRQAFSDTQKAVNECPKIFFQDPNAKVYLHTDASNYGIGAYLFQLIDGKEIPIMFLSKSLNKTERKWSVYEKEGYAIFYSFMKMEHLLRDAKFLLRTDHRNLLFINTDMRDKVKRWKLAIQHFDFDVEHIKGELNIEADGFSRLIETIDGEPREFVVQNTINALRTVTPELDMLPPAIYNKIMQFHNATIGHHGVERTLQKLKESDITWKKMRKDVKLFIERCPCCQKMSVLKPIIHTKPFTLASYSPFDRICVDTIGPLPTDIDSGSEYILVIIDAFSRFVKLYPVKDTSAKAALHSLIDWMGMFGIPSEVVSDNGTQFANELITCFLDTLGTTNVKIHAYSKEENGMVERANKEVNRHLRTLVYNRKVKSKWTTYLPLTQRIMNASVHYTLGVSPAQLVFGNAVRLDRNLLPLAPLLHSDKANVYLESLLDAQREIVQIALRNQMQTDQFHIATRGGNQPITEFPINSYVLVNYENTDHRPPSKLHTFLRGPLRIVNRNGPIYTLENLVKNKLEDFHIKLLHPFKFDAAIIDPTEIAQHDEDHFGIVDVLQHRFTSERQSRQDLEFLVRFDDDPNPIWQPWSADIRDNEQIHAYLNRNHMRKFIPIKYTYPRDHPLYEKPEPRPAESYQTRKKRRKFGRY